MKGIRILLPLIIAISIHSSSFSQNNDIARLKQNLTDDAINEFGFKPRTERYTPFEFEKAKEYLQSMNLEGSWADVDYKDRDNDWSPLVHLNRILIMTLNYVAPEGKLLNNSALHDGIERALNYWYTVNPKCDNWYKNVIAKQFYFNVIGLLLEDKIDAKLHEKIVNDLTKEPTMTGSNRTLVAISTIYRGVLENNPERIKWGVNGVTDQIEITAKEGVQPDFSFHQHGHFLYNGSYGANFLRESIWLATMVHNTGFAYTSDQIKVLRNYYLKGTRWMVRGGVIDYNVRGRQVGRHDAFNLGGDILLPQLDHLMIADPEYNEAYQISKQKIIEHEPQEIAGNKHFWRSDYTAHHRHNYFTSLKMCSERTVGIELNMNSENKLGYWLPYGLTYIYRRGDEYLSIFPVWDWARLPGVTAPHHEVKSTRKGEAHTQQTAFVGGVSDGKYGVSSMDFSKDKTRAKKSWFWFDDEWVALGAGIQSDYDAPIVTGINQTLLKGKVILNGKQFTDKEKTINQSCWILHDKVGYIIPEGKKLHITAKEQSGNLQRIFGLGKDTVYTMNVFSLWFEHGLHPENESYQYIVVPETDLTNMTEYYKNQPVEILENSEKMQAVRHKLLGITGIAFHQSGEFRMTNFTIGVDKPALILWNETDETISLSEPTTQHQFIKVTIKENNKSPKIKSISLPLNEYAGKSITLSWADFTD